MKLNSQRRDILFRHLDGITTAPTAYSLYKKGVLNYILQNQKVSLTELVSKFNANEGYLNVALRVLASQGWLTQNIDNKNDVILFEINEKRQKILKGIDKSCGQNMIFRAQTIIFHSCMQFVR